MKIKCTKDNNVKLCVSHQSKFNKPIKQLREAVEQNRFGRLVNYFGIEVWNTTRKLLGEVHGHLMWYFNEPMYT